MNNEYVEQIPPKKVVADVNPNFFAVRFDNSASPISYVGKASVGSATNSAVWQIFKLDETSGVVITYADGNPNFDNVWDNRASLSYS